MGDVIASRQQAPGYSAVEEEWRLSHYIKGFAAYEVLVVIGHERNILFIDAPPDLTVAWKTFYL